MATYFVNGTTGNNASAGTSWATARQTVTSALTLATTTGDIIVVDAAGAFTANAAIVWVPTAGCLSVAVISATNGGGTSYTPAFGAVESCGTTGEFQINCINQGSMYIYGMDLRSSVQNAAAAGVNFYRTASVSGQVTCDECRLEHRSTNTSSGFYIGITATATTRAVALRLLNCDLVVSASRLGQCIHMGEASLEMAGCTLTCTGASKPPNAFTVLNVADTADVLVRNCDFSAVSLIPFLVTNAAGLKAVVKNTKFQNVAMTSGTWPGGWGSITVRNAYTSAEVPFYHASSNGTLTESTTIFVNDASGAEFDGVNTSWQIVTSSLVNESNPFISPLLEIWGATVGAQTASIDIVRDSATAWTNRDLWSEIDYPGADAASALYTVHSNRNVPAFVGAGTALPSSTPAWNDAFTNQNRQRLQHAITTTEAGLIQMRFFCTVPSATFYVNPVIGGIT